MIRNYNEVKVPMSLAYSARAMVSKEAILKCRNDELKQVLGRLKELLNEDEVVIIAHNEAFGKACRRKEVKKTQTETEFRQDYFTIGQADAWTNTRPMYYTNTTTTTGNATFTWR